MTRLQGIGPALAALAACTAGGAVCFLLHTPLPWMTGSLVTMAALKFSGLKVAAPRGARKPLEWSAPELEGRSLALEWL